MTTRVPGLGQMPFTPYLRAGAGAAALGVAVLTVVSIGGQQPTYLEGYVLLLAAGLLVYTFPEAPPMAAAFRVPRFSSGVRFGAGVAAIVAGCLTAWWAGYTGYNNLADLFYGGLLAYLIGALLLGAGLFLISPTTLVFPSLGAFIRRHAVEIVLVSAVLGLALALRLYQLGVYPPGDGYSWIDEPQMGQRATDVLKYGGHQWQFPELVYGVALSFKLFGASMLSMRYPVVLAGFLVVGVFYALARYLFPWPVALAGTLLLAVSRWEIAYFRMDLPACTIMLFELIALLCALYAARGRATYACYAVMGLCVGLGGYSHPSARLVPVILGLWWIGWLIHERRRLRSLVRAHGLGWLLFLEVAFVVSLPYWGQVRQDPHASLTERFTSIMPLLFNRGILPDPVGLLKSNATWIFGYFTGPGDPWSAVNPLNTPMLDPVTGALFILGLGYVLLRWRPRFGLLIALWALLTLVAGGLVTADFRGERIIGMLPAVYLLACIPLNLLWSSLATRRESWSAGSLAVGGLAAGVAAAAINFHTLYDVQSHDPVVRTTFQYQPIQLLDFVRRHGEQSYGYFLADMAYPGPGTDYGWSVGEPAGRSADDLDDMLPVHDAVGSARTVTMATAPPYPVDPIGNAISQVYPGAHVYRWTNPDDGRHYVGAVISAHALDPPAASSGRCVPVAECWRGSIYIPVSGLYRLSPGGAGGHVAGQSLELAGRTVPRQVQLSPGWYTVSLLGRAHISLPHIVWQGPSVSGAVPGQYLRNAPAHGLLLQLREQPTPGPETLEAQRVPFPFFMFPMSHNIGRPADMTSGFRYRALFTGHIESGHAGSYALQLWSQGGTATLYLDGRPVARTPATVDGATTDLSLWFSGGKHRLQLLFNADIQQGGITGAGLFNRPAEGPMGFLPWGWFSPPSPWAGQPSWPSG